MSLIWFILAVSFFILWITKKPDSSDGGYSQGYWDGYRDLGGKVNDELDKDTTDTHAIRRFIQVGFGGQAPPASPPLQQNTETTSDDLQITQTVATEATGQVMSDEEVQRRAEQTSLKNLNILLFTASLLLVAAGAAFVAAAMPDSVKLVGVWLLTTAFYGTGMLLHYSSERMKPAAVAFLGTGLGLIPFAGVALHQLAGVDPAVAWCITSLIGLIAYFWAAVRLQSQVVSYLTLAFVISLASSFSESVSLPIMWNFVLIIGISLTANVVALIKPTWVPRIFSDPIEKTGQLVTPLALVASLLLADTMTQLSYEVVFGVATLHYVVAWLQSRQLGYETAARVLAHITALIVAWDIANSDVMLFGYIFLAVATLQQVYSFAVSRLFAAARRRSLEVGWVCLMQFAQLVSIIFWLGSSHAAALSSLSLALIAVSSIIATFLYRNIKLASSVLAVSVILPFVICRGVFEPALDLEYVTGIIMLGGVFSLVTWRFIAKRSVMVRNFFTTSFVIYVATATVLAGTLAAESSAVVLLILTIMSWLATYGMRASFLSVVGNFLFVLTAVQVWRAFDFDQTWLVLGVAWISASLFYLTHWLLSLSGDKERAFGLLASVWTVLGLGIFLTFFDSELELASALTIVVVALTIGIEGYRRKQDTMIELAAYVATFGLQRSIGIAFEELNIVFYAHWWALTAAAVAVWRRELTARLKIGMGLITVSTGLYALGEGGFYQLLFLVEHLMLLTVGALLSKRWAIWWGLSAAVLAVLYFLKDFAFLALGFLGLLIIGIVVWRLTKINQHSN